MSVITYNIPPQHFVIVNSPQMERPALMWSGPGGEMATGEQTTYDLYTIEQVYDLIPLAIEAGVPEEEVMEIVQLAMSEVDDV